MLKLITKNAALRTNCFQKEILSINSVLNSVNSRPITGKLMREEKTRPAPWPYREKPYTWFRMAYDGTTKRFDENTKIIVVDGPVASGKSEFAKKLAEELDFFHIPDPTMDSYYINPGGYDMRQLDYKLPLSCQSFDEKDFCETPKHRNVANFQLTKFRLRYSFYVDAFSHLLNTGQGVVIERCPYGDIAFVDAMYKSGFIDKSTVTYYYALCRHVFPYIIRPHLIIYLDVPVSKTLENIKKRNIDYEVDSPLFKNEDYLTKLEEGFKDQFLKNISTHSKILVYDWSEKGDLEIVVEDIERIDFESPIKDRNEHILADWRLEPCEYDIMRRRFSAQKVELMWLFATVASIECPEVLINGNDCGVFERVWLNAPGIKRAKGYDPTFDSNIMWKTKDYEGYNTSL